MKNRDHQPIAVCIVFVLLIELSTSDSTTSTTPSAATAAAATSAVDEVSTIIEPFVSGTSSSGSSETTTESPRSTATSESQTTTAAAYSSPTTTSASTSTTSTTQLTTTSTAAKPTTPAGSKPVELDRVHLSMPFIIRYLADKFPDGLGDTTSSVFIMYRDNFIAQINKIYLKCPGFDSTRTQVARFRPGSIDVDYIINIISKSALNNAPEISAFLTNNETLGGFMNMVLGNFTVDRSFVESNLSKQLTTQAQGVQTFASDPCNPNDAKKMCAICSKCFYSVHLENPVSCSPLCPDKGQTCSTDEQLQVANCICAPHYLLMAGNCVHQDIVIGIFAGIGGAIFSCYCFGTVFQKSL